MSIAPQYLVCVCLCVCVCVCVCVFRKCIFCFYQNGRHYRTNGFPRTCYLPNNEKGQKVRLPVFFNLQVVCNI